MNICRIKIFAASILLFWNGCFTHNTFAISNSNDALETFGDYMQIINPIVASCVASQDRGLGHFLAIYTSTIVIVHSNKMIGKSLKWEINRRPFVANRNDRYDGMPSGHTASAFAAAAYVRTFADEYKPLAIPLYISAAITGYSRIHAKKHTVAQVVVGAALTEIVTFVYSKLDWSKNYQSHIISVFPDHYAINFRLKL